MDKILGIVAEYNPFHNGHLEHLNKTKLELNYDATIAVMSGNFVERGIPAITNKFNRAQMAINAGIDLVLELPCIYSLSSAENFAYGAISILNSCKIVNYLSFGSECGELEKLNKIASFLLNETSEYSIKINEYLKKGNSFPKARALCIKDFLGEEYFEIVQNPNNILGIEYLKALKKLSSPITPLTVSRNGNYNSLEETHGTLSGKGIRNKISNSKDISSYVPEITLKLLKEDNIFKSASFSSELTAFENEILYIFRKMDILDILNLPDVTQNLANKIKNASNTCNMLSSFIEKIKSKDITEARINRILCYALLNITKKDMEDSKEIIPYIRVLGFTQKGKNLISQIQKNNPSVNLIVQPKKFLEGTNQDIILKSMLEKDILASDIYSLKSQIQYEAGSDFKLFLGNN